LDRGDFIHKSAMKPKSLTRSDVFFTDWATNTRDFTPERGIARKPNVCEEFSDQHALYRRTRKRRTIPMLKTRIWGERETVKLVEEILLTDSAVKPKPNLSCKTSTNTESRSAWHGILHQQEVCRKPNCTGNFFGAMRPRIEGSGTNLSGSTTTPNKNQRKNAQVIERTPQSGRRASQWGRIGITDREQSTSEAGVATPTAKPWKLSYMNPNNTPDKFLPPFPLWASEAYKPTRVTARYNVQTVIKESNSSRW
jgi:hypothetical protein